MVTVAFAKYGHAFVHAGHAKFSDRSSGRSRVEFGRRSGQAGCDQLRVCRRVSEDHVSATHDVENAGHIDNHAECTQRRNTSSCWMRHNLHVQEE